MRALSKRLARIEERLHPVADTEHLRRLRARLDAAKARMANPGQPFVAVRGESGRNTLGGTLSERLQLGRKRAFERVAGNRQDRHVVY